MQVRTVPVRRPIVGTDFAEHTKHVFEALKEVADSRATKQLIKEAQSAGVKAHIILPIVDECLVDARQLGRAFRQVIRACIEEGRGGAEFGVGFSFADPKQLTILGAPLEELAPTLVGKLPN